jgi:hypothetical protein
LLGRGVAQVESASVEHRERVLGVVGGHVGVAHPCRRRARLASAGQVSSMEVGPRRSAARCLNHPFEESRDNSHTTPLE